MSMKRRAHGTALLSRRALATMRLPAALLPLLRLLISPLLILSSLSLNRAHTASLSSASTSTSASTLSSTSFLSLSLSLSRAGCNDPSHTYDQLVAFGSHLASRRRFRQSAHCYKRALDSYWQSLRSPTGEHAAFMQFTQSKAHEMRILDTHISHLSRRTERMNIPMFGHRDPDQRYDDEGRPQIPPQVILERHLAAMRGGKVGRATRAKAEQRAEGARAAAKVQTQRVWAAAKRSAAAEEGEGDGDGEGEGAGDGGGDGSGDGSEGGTSGKVQTQIKP